MLSLKTRFHGNGMDMTGGRDQRISLELLRLDDHVSTDRAVREWCEERLGFSSLDLLLFGYI